MRAVDERQQIAKNARDSFDGFWNRFPTFWSANRQAQLKRLKYCTGASTLARGIIP